MVEQANKFERIRELMEEKYGNEVNVTLNQERPKVRRRYSVDILADVVKLTSTLNFGESITLHFKDAATAFKCANTIRYHVKSQKIELRVSLRLDEVYLLKEKQEKIILQ